jgi:hypothetical protein
VDEFLDLSTWPTTENQFIGRDSGEQDSQGDGVGSNYDQWPPVEAHVASGSALQHARAPTTLTVQDSISRIAVQPLKTVSSRSRKPNWPCSHTTQFQGRLLGIPTFPWKSISRVCPTSTKNAQTPKAESHFCTQTMLTILPYFVHLHLYPRNHYILSGGLVLSVYSLSYTNH